jgi:hypothetical protein
MQRRRRDPVRVGRRVASAPEGQLCLMTEDSIESSQRVLPTLAVVLGQAGFGGLLISEVASAESVGRPGPAWWCVSDLPGYKLAWDRCGRGEKPARDRTPWRGGGNAAGGLVDCVQVAARVNCIGGVARVVDGGCAGFISTACDDRVLVTTFPDRRRRRGPLRADRRQPVSHHDRR